jgi:hypothetical protein
MPSSHLSLGSRSRKRFLGLNIFYVVVLDLGSIVAAKLGGDLVRRNPC